MQTIEASKGKWQQIFKGLGLPPFTGNSHYKGECPSCGKKGKFRFDDRSGDGDWICVCGSGKGIGLIQEVFQISFDEACDKVDKLINNTSHKVKVDGGFKTKSELAEERFVTYNNIKGTDAEHYLKSRGIYKMPSANSIRFCGKFEYDHVKHIYFPSMVAKVTSHGNNYVYNHVTFLFNGEKIKIDPGRKMFSLSNDNKGASIRLFKATETLGVAEGIETALSASQIYNVPVWSTLNTTLMKKFVCPDKIKKLIIFADNDQNLSGQAAAYECARRNMLIKNSLESITIMWPQNIGDFNDSLLNNNYITVNQKFTKK